MLLESLVSSLRSGDVEIVDLTATSSEATPVIPIPATDPVLVVSLPKIAGGPGSPARVLALVPR
jgi:hypothetical protein